MCAKGLREALGAHLGIPGYGSKQEAESAEAKKGKELKAQIAKERAEKVETNSNKLAKDCLRWLINFLENEATPRSSRFSAEQEEEVDGYDPSERYTSEQLQTLRMHLAKFRQELAELETGEHMEDQQQERRYAQIAMDVIAGKKAYVTFLREIGVYYRSGPASSAKTKRG